MSASTRKNILATCLLTGGVLLFWWKIVFLGLTPTIDEPGHLYEEFLSVIPARHLIVELLRGGHMPLWSPYGQAGMILFADPHFTPAYPLTWIGLLLSTGATFNLIILLHTLIAAIPLYFLMLRLRVRAGAALITAFVYAFSLPMSYSFLLPSHSSWQWIPLLMLLSASYIESGKRSALALLALAWCVQVTTFIQSSYNLALLLGGFSVFYCAARVRPPSRAAKKLMVLIVALALGTGLASAYLVPLFEFKSQWAYKKFTYQAATVGSYSPEFILESFLCGCPWNSPVAWILNLYMSSVGVVLALYALVYSLRRRVVLFFWAAVILLVCLSLGSSTPLYKLFHSFVPGARYFHAPLRFLWGVPFCMAVIAGFGADRFLYRNGSGSRRANALRFLVVLAGASFILLVISRHGQTIAPQIKVSPGTLHSLLIPAISLCVLLVPYLLGLLKRRWLIAGFILLMAFEGQRGLSHLVFFDLDQKYRASASVRFLKSRQEAGRFFSYNRGLDRYASSFLDEDSVPMIYPELSNYFGLYDIQARGPLRIDRYDKLIKAVNAKHEIVYDLGFYMAEIRDYASPIIDLFGVTHIISKGELQPRDLIVYENPWELTLDSDQAFTLRLDEPLTTEAIYLRSFLEGAATAAQGETVATITIQLGERALGIYEARAGIHTAEVFDLNDSRKRDFVSHGKGTECESWDELLWNGRRLRGSHYRGIIDLAEEQTFDRIEIKYIHPSGVMRLTRIGCRPAGPQKELERFVPVFKDEKHGIIIYENKRALPRAFLVHGVDVTKSPEEALDRILDDSFDFRNRVVLEEEPPAWFREGGREDFSRDEARIVEYSPNRIEVAVRTEVPAFLFLSDIYYPGWDSYIDGEITTTYRADYAFRAVAVPAGEHEVVMVFRPRSLMIGSFFSLASLLGLVVFIICCRHSPVKR